MPVAVQIGLALAGVFVATMIAIIIVQRVVGEAKMRMIALGLAGLMLWIVPAGAQDLLVEKASGAGPTDLSIVNRDAAPITITRIEVNRRADETCNLVPVDGDFGVTFVRGDWEIGWTAKFKKAFGERRALAAVTLRYGDEVAAVAPSACGRVLEVQVHTDVGTGTFTFER